MLVDADALNALASLPDGLSHAEVRAWFTDRRPLTRMYFFDTLRAISAE